MQDGGLGQFRDADALPFALGVGIVVHTGAYLHLVNDAKEVIPVTIAGALNALKAAYAEPSVKRFVHTSSATAAFGALSHGITVTEETWNEKAVERAWAPPPYEPDRPAFVYEASKTQSEQEIWKFHRQNRSRRPDLVVNSGTFPRVQRHHDPSPKATLTASSPP